MEPEIQEEKTVSETTIYDGKIIHVKNLLVTLPTGKTANREVVLHPGAVAILAQVKPGQVVCVKQFRKAPEETLLEIPAGKLEPGEDPEACANRELQEETGFRPVSIRKVAEFFTSPGFANEKIHLYFAETCEPGQASPDEDEFVSVSHVTREEVKNLIEAGRVRDAKTLIAFLWWLNQ